MLTGMEMKNYFVFTKIQHYCGLGQSGKMSGCKKVVSHCALCKERLKDVHSHPGRWKVELQQFLLRYSDVPLTACVCRADEISIKKG